MAALSPIARRALTAAYLVLATVVFLVLGFPSEALRAYATRRLSAALPGLGVTVGDVRLSLPAGIAVLRGPEFRFALVNPAYQALSPDRQFLGRTVAEVWPELAPQVLPLLRSVVSTGTPFHADDMRFEVNRPGARGTEDRFFSFTYLAMPRAGAEPAEILVTVVETTERVRAVRQLAASEARLRAILDGTQDAFFRTDLSGRIVMASPSARAASIFWISASSLCQLG